ncbi:hypothetical protein [Flexithrix dorotheae]|uniref:hypothetical protein n=1 Tax=Flexithrix dorotheae TaxID=70993 RepID=UPI0003815C95|nr:hypothetical protein [Flexithrix dorotheae]
MSQHNQKRGQGNLSPYDNKLLFQFLENQKKQIENEAAGLKIREKEVNNSHDYAKFALTKNVEDFKQYREYDYKKTKMKWIFTGLISFGIIGLIMFSLSSEHPEFAMEFLKILGTALVSGGGGYYYGKSQSQSDKKYEVEEVEEVD